MDDLTNIAQTDVAINSAGKNLLRADFSNASLLWRQFLQRDSKYPLNHKISAEELVQDNEDRYNAAHCILFPYIRKSILDVPFADGTSALSKLLENKHAMTLLTERHSAIRDTANMFAHSLPSYSILRKSLVGDDSPFATTPAVMQGIDGIILFLEHMHPPPTSVSSQPTAMAAVPQATRTISKESTSRSWASVVAKPAGTSPHSSLVPPTHSQMRASTSKSASSKSASPSPSPSPSLQPPRSTSTSNRIGRPTTSSRGPSATTTLSRGPSTTSRAAGSQFTHDGSTSETVIPSRRKGTSGPSNQHRL